jgi:hypothetical protein
MKKIQAEGYLAARTEYAAAAAKRMRLTEALRAERLKRDAELPPVEPKVRKSRKNSVT